MTTQTIVPKNIFMFWHDEKLPNDIQIYFNRIVLLHSDYKIEVYNSERVLNEFPEITDLYNQLDSKQHKCDLVRLYLLYNKVKFLQECASTKC